MNGLLKTYENNTMSLSCSGEAQIIDGVISQISFKGFPRKRGDEWVSFYTERRVGDTVTKEDIEAINYYNKKNNVVSVFEWVDQSEKPD